MEAATLSTAPALDVAAPTQKAGKRRVKANAGRNASSSSPSSNNELSSKESLGGALARAALGSLAFFFRLPIRLFRPVKLSSWTVLESFAKREKKSLSLAYVWRLLRRENRTFIFHLLGPPFLFNTIIGFTLFEAYSLTEARLLRKHRPDLLQQQPAPQSGQEAQSIKKATWTPIWMVAIAGSAAGAAQCILSAPLDNVRLVLTSNKSKVHKRRRGIAASGEAAQRQPTTISWRAVFRAALLPFAPEQSHQRLVRAVKSDHHQRSEAAVKDQQSFFTQEQRKLWQQRLKRLGGSVHGAGLVMSLARDSLGFAMFFSVFEISRRVAYTTSTAIDRSIAWWSATGTLPSRGAITSSTKETMTDQDRDELYDTKAIQIDLSYNASRTKSGRVIAATVLIVGGAIGAFAYEAVGRPFELMRLIIWQGRQEWQKARERQARRARGGRTVRSLRIKSRRGKGQVMVTAANVSTSRLESLLTLRAVNSAGTRMTRMQARFSQSHPPHPLRRLGKQIAAASATKQSSSSDGLSKAKAAKQQQQRRHQAYHAKHNGSHVPRTPPSALSLLLKHAEKTSTLAYTSSSRKFRTAVPAPILLVHTYFIAPYLTSLTSPTAGSGDGTTTSSPGQRQQGHSSSQPGASTGRFSTTAESAARLLSRWINKNPVSSSSLLNFQQGGSSSSTGASTSVGASGGGLRLSYLPPKPAEAPGSLRTASAARSWGSGRTAWALRRLASPYALGMLCFAWLTGDV